MVWCVGFLGCVGRGTSLCFGFQLKLILLSLLLFPSFVAHNVFVTSWKTGFQRFQLQSAILLIWRARSPFLLDAIDMKVGWFQHRMVWDLGFLDRAENLIYVIVVFLYGQLYRLLILVDFIHVLMVEEGLEHLWTGETRMLQRDVLRRVIIEPHNKTIKRCAIIHL